MLPNKFRPQDLTKTFIMKERLKYGRSDNYNFQTRIEWYPVGYKLNKKTIVKQFGKLHYLACHAPEPVAKKWKSAYNQFEKKYFASSGNASMRFLNTWTAHSWL
jgi:hypothetical protein